MLNEEVEEEEVNEGDDDDYQEDLFFDFESRRDADRHIANLLIVQDETGFETMFKGDLCVEEFTLWLLDGTHQGATVIAHNLRGYDGFLLCEKKKLLLPKLISNRATIVSMELKEHQSFRTRYHWSHPSSRLPTGSKVFCYGSIFKWLAWVHQQTGDRILHALNGGEQRIDGSYVDGYDPLRKTIYEFM